MRLSKWIIVPLLLISTSAIADTLSAFTQARAYNCLQTAADCNIGTDIMAVSGGVASVSDSYESPNTLAQLTASSSAVSNYGTLGASASSSINISGTPAIAYSVGVASFEDVITVSDAPLTGQTGFMDVSYTLDGSSDTSGSDNAIAVLRVEFGTDLEQVYQTAYTSASGSYDIPEAFQFTYGTPFGLDFALLASTGTFAPTGVSLIYEPETGSGSANVDFFNTLVLSGLQVTDSKGDPVPDATFSSLSGTQYTQAGVVLTPEPPSSILLFTGLVLGSVRLLPIRCFRKRAI